jgi:RecA-family ATPase
MRTQTADEMYNSLLKFAVKPDRNEKDHETPLNFGGDIVTSSQPAQPIGNNRQAIKAELEQLKNQQDSELEWLDGDDLADNAKAPNYLINDILEADSHGILIAQSMAFKTFAAIEMAHCLCTGNEFMGHEVFTTGKVLYICGEGKGALSRRVKALKIVKGGFNNNLMVLHSRIGIDDNKDMLERLKPLLAQHQPLFVILDTFSSLATETDENSNNDVAKVLRLIKDTCTNGITSSMVVHHNGKDTAKGARGASAFQGNVEFEFSMKRDSESMMTTLHCVKQKDGEIFADIHMIAHVVELGLVRQDGKMATSLILKQCDESEKPKAKAKQLTSRQQDILSTLHKAIELHGITPTDDIKALYPDSPYNCPNKVIHTDKWRDLAHAVLDVSNKTKAFSDCKTQLSDAKKIKFHDGYYWIT